MDRKGPFVGAAVPSGPRQPPHHRQRAKNAPRDCCHARRASKQGKQNAPDTHRRAAAGGESKHNHKSAPALVKSPPGFPSGWLPRGPGPQPRRTLVTFLRGKVTRPQAEPPQPARRRKIPPSPKTKLPWTQRSTAVFPFMRASIRTQAPQRPDRCPRCRS